MRKADQVFSKVLGLDVGDKVVGLAVGVMETGLIERRGAKARAKYVAESEILKIIKDENIAKVVIGLPRGQAGAENAQTLKVRNFVRRLKKRSTVPLIFVDEYLTTETAHEQLREEGFSNFRAIKNSGLLDSQAAAVILRSYFEGKDSVIVDCY